MSAIAFDPADYIADMRALGVELTPYTIAANGRRVFSIAAAAGNSSDVMTVAARWERAALAHPDWSAAVHDALVHERVTA